MPTKHRQEKDIVSALDKGYHALFESDFARVEVYRLLDREGAGYCVLTTGGEDDLHTEEIITRSRAEAERALAMFSPLGEWIVYNPYPVQEFSVADDEDEYELMTRGGEND